jgi:hypothetical protein
VNEESADLPLGIRSMILIHEKAECTWSRSGYDEEEQIFLVLQESKQRIVQPLAWSKTDYTTPPPLLVILSVSIK